MRWLINSLGSQDFTPTQRHYWWRSILNLSASDPFLDDHLFLSELLEAAVCYDQLNVPNPAMLEMAARHYQRYEEIYANSLRSSE